MYLIQATRTVYLKTFTQAHKPFLQVLHVFNPSILVKTARTEYLIKFTHAHRPFLQANCQLT
jgi:hypothetical protein